MQLHPLTRESTQLSSVAHPSSEYIVHLIHECELNCQRAMTLSELFDEPDHDIVALLDGLILSNRVQCTQQKQRQSVWQLFDLHKEPTQKLYRLSQPSAFSPCHSNTLCASFTRQFISTHAVSTLQLQLQLATKWWMKL